MSGESKESEGPSTGPDGRREKARDLLADWRTWLSEGLNQVEAFTKEKPAAGLTLSFLAGFLIAALFRRRA